MRDKIYYDGELADYDDIERIENLYYTSKPVDVDDVSLDSEYDYRRLPKFIQEDIDYAESANDLISKGNFLDADDEEFTFNDIMKYEYKGDTYIIRAEGYSYPRYVVKITNVGESFAKGGKISPKDEYITIRIDEVDRLRALKVNQQPNVYIIDERKKDGFVDFLIARDGEEFLVKNLIDNDIPYNTIRYKSDDPKIFRSKSPSYAKGGDIKSMNMIELESIGTIIDPQTGMTYAMMADGKSYDPDTETHITEIDMSEYDYQITEKDREILLDILQYPEAEDIFARGGMFEHGLRVGDKITSSLPNDSVEVIDEFDNEVEINLNTGQRQDLRFAKGGKISKDEAIVKAMRMGVNFNKQFHAQSYGNELAELARETGYRKSKSSSGSLGRAFFEHLEKRYDKSPEYYDNISKNDMFAKGGLLEHGLKSGDRIMFPLSDNRIEVQDLFGQSKQVDLDTGERTEMRYSKGGKTPKYNYSIPFLKFYKEFFEEEGEKFTLQEVNDKLIEDRIQEYDIKAKGGKVKKDIMLEHDNGMTYTFITQKEADILEDKGLASFDPINENYEYNSNFDNSDWESFEKQLGYLPMAQTYAKGGMTGKKTYLLERYFVDVYEDSYEEGEQELVHNWNSRDMQDANREFPNKEALLNYLKDIIESQVTGQYELKDDFFDINDMGDGKVIINTSVMAKYDNRGYGDYIYPTQEEKDMWKKAEQTLFSVNYSFSVEVYKKTNLSF